MAARDSDDDIRKYLPDLSAILREADPARAKEKLTKAQDNPELDAVLAQVQRPSARPSEESPWAAEPAGIAATALPSSLVAPPVVKEPEAPPGRRAPFPGWAKAIVAVIAVVGPVTLLWLLLVRPGGRQDIDPARMGASAGSSVPIAPSMSASAVPSTSTRAPTPIPPPPALKATADVDAGASAPLTAPSAIAPTKPNGHATAAGDPYDAAPPGPAKTVEPPHPAPMIF